MSSFEEKARDFLAQQRIAVAGVSATKNSPANAIYKALRERGYQVFAVNPTAEMIEGDPCYPSVKDVPESLDGVFILTNAEHSLSIVKDAVEAKVPRVWMHYNGLLPSSMSSVSDEAVALGEANGITVIAGGCPNMFLDFPHKCMRWLLGVMNKLPA